MHLFVCLSKRMQIEIKSADCNQVKNVRTSDPEFKAIYDTPLGAARSGRVSICMLQAVHLKFVVRREIIKRRNGVLGQTKKRREEEER